MEEVAECALYHLFPGKLCVFILIQNSYFEDDAIYLGRRYRSDKSSFKKMFPFSVNSLSKDKCGMRVPPFGFYSKICRACKGISKIHLLHIFHQGLGDTWGT